MSENENEIMDVEEVEEYDGPSEVFNSKKHELPEDTELVMDESAYVLYQQLNVEHSCLSFDIIPDNLGSGEVRSNEFPYTLYSINGSQSSEGHNNSLTIVKLSNLHKLKHKEDDSEDEDEEVENLDEEAEINSITILHNGAVNRVRTHSYNNKTFAASWSEMGHVYFWDLTNQIWAVNDAAYMSKMIEDQVVTKPVYTVRNHKIEGYAMDWSPCNPGTLISGDNNGHIYLTTANESGFNVMPDALLHHKKSVEDVQWSPNQPSIFISGSADGSVAVWDTRSMSNQVSLPGAHDSDINVISWNPVCMYSLITGGDDGLLKLWDMRMFSKGVSGCTPTHVYDYHRGCPITSVEWCPESEYVFAASSEDDQLTMWDVSMEQDEQQQVATPGEEEYPVHLLFNHMGQKEIKELHWHKQIPGVIMSTSLDGFCVFRTISV